MRVLVTSDTHLRSGADLPTVLLELAGRADHIVHAGDLVSSDVLSVLRAFAPVTAVHGNCCERDLVAMLPERVEVDIAGARFGVVHDAGPSAGRLERLATWFEGCDVVVHGHTHDPEIVCGEDERRLLVVNPGSPVDRRRAPNHTAAWLEVDANGVVTADLVLLDG